MLSQKVLETELNPNQSSPSTPSSQSSSPKGLKRPPSSTQKPQPSPNPQSQRPKPKPKRPGRKLLAFDRRLGARFVAGVLLDYECLRDHRVRPLALLNDSKQLTSAGREELFRAVLACAAKVTVRAISAREIDATGLHRSNLAAMRAILWELSPPAEICLVDGFRLGPTAPEHRAVVDGDEKSAAIAAASVIAKVVRDRTMRRLAALYPHYGFSSHVGYITPRHSAVVRERGPSDIHRRSFEARCYAPEQLAEPDAA